jgi:hypothetical protein
MPGFRSRSANALPVWIADDDGNPLLVGGRQETLNLITNNVVQPPQQAYGGDYVWSVQGTFGGASVQLQSLGPDGATYQNIGAAKTAPDTNGGTGVGLGSNATVRATVTGGTPSGIYASLSRLP